MSAAPQWLPERPVQLQGHPWARRVLGWFGWEVVFNGLPGRQGLLIAYPHTSNWDFPIGVLAKWALGLPAHFWAKDSLFSLPLLGRWMRWIGGIPVDRSGARGVAGTMAERIRQARADGEFFWLALAPEGTRSWVPHWRSGFYAVAQQAELPLGLVFFDYRRKRVGVDTFLMPSGDAEADMAVLADYYREHSHGCRPTLAGPVRLK